MGQTGVIIIHQLLPPSPLQSVAVMHNCGAALYGNGLCKISGPCRCDPACIQAEEWQLMITFYQGPLFQSSVFRF